MPSRGLALLLALSSVGAATLVPYHALEARRVLAKAADNGQLALVGYAKPPSSSDAPVNLPPVDSRLEAGDGTPIFAISIQEAAERVGRGEHDAILVPILNEVDGVTAGKEVSGFIKLQFISPSTVSYTEGVLDPAVLEAQQRAARNALLSKTAIALREPLGVTVSPRQGKPEVATLSDEGPFKAAGVVIGDWLTHVNGVSVESQSAEDAVAAMKLAEFPKSLTFLRNENSYVDQTVEHPEGFFVVMAPPLLVGITLPYKRAMFGTVPSCEPYRVILASPVEGCRRFAEPQPWNTSVDALDAIMFAERGVCKFEDKALVAHNMGAKAVVISNSKDGGEVARMPASSATVKVPVSAVMVAHAPARLFQASKLLSEPVVLQRKTPDCLAGGGAWVPIRPTLPPKTRRYSKDDAKAVGVVFIHQGNGSAPLQTFEFMAAQYGPLASDRIPLAKLVMAVPENGCVPQGSSLLNAAQIMGNIAVIKRGSCMFPDKTLVAQNAKALGVIIINTDKNLVRLPAPPEFDLRVVRIPTVLVPPTFEAVMPKFANDPTPVGRMILYDPPS